MKTIAKPTETAGKRAVNQKRQPVNIIFQNLEYVKLFIQNTWQFHAKLENFKVSKKYKQGY